MYQQPKAKLIEPSTSPTIDHKELQITLKLQHPFQSANRVIEEPNSGLKVQTNYSNDISVFSTNDDTNYSLRNTAIDESPATPSIRKIKMSKW